MKLRHQILVVAGLMLLVAGVAYAQQVITGTVTANPGNIGNTTAWLIKIGDNTNGPVAVKPASTAPAAGDASLVVTMSPNSSLPLPTGAATSANQSTANASLATIATNTGAAIPLGGNVIGYTSNDLCAQFKTTTVPISQTSSTTLIAGTSAKKTYICSIAIIASAGETINLITGTGSACATTQTAALFGSTTTANGAALAANGGLTLGNGSATVMGGLGNTADNVCLTQVGSSRLAGTVTYVQQ